MSNIDSDVIARNVMVHQYATMVIQTLEESGMSPETVAKTLSTALGYLIAHAHWPQSPPEECADSARELVVSASLAWRIGRILQEKSGCAGTA